MENETGRGGKREGAGRKTGDKSRLQLWVTADEKELLNQTLADMRSGKLKKFPCPKRCGGNLEIGYYQGQVALRCDTCVYRK